MKKGKPSFSAEVMAFYRAAESAKPEAERLYYDPLARAFLRMPLRLLAGSRMLAGLTIWFLTERWIPGGVGVVLARSRYIDDCLKGCLAEGVGQLVILGAGYDSRAYRSDILSRDVKVFEVDHPATQRAKIRRLIDSLGYLPRHVAYTPVNLMEEPPGKRLIEKGYERSLKTLFICEGVSYYLSAKAMDGVLSFVAESSAPGSSLVFDYFVQMTADEARKAKMSHWRLERMARSARLSGEPVLFRMQPLAVEGFLAQRGFELKTNLAAQDLKSIYFTGKNEKRQVSPHLAVAHATVRGPTRDGVGSCCS
ncbi:MAG: class I SAM-dependent methyltransferase [Dehalococcoidia bacterium]|nr:class I SAM-dependent methyltransferase [Dehalococcoidia bacterium]